MKKLVLMPTIAGGTLLAGAIASVTAAPPADRVSPLRVGLMAVADPAGGFQGQVEVTVTNTSRHTARVPKWQLPSNLVESKLFQISRDGATVAYQGPMIKRGLPQAEDFVILRAGETLRSVVDLSKAYDFSQSGQYVVAMDSALQFASLSDGSALNQKNGLPQVAKSAPLSLWVAGKGANVGVQGKPGGGGGSSVVGGVSYKSCSATQIDSIGSAVNAARGYAENAKGYLNAGTVGPRYTTWFGSYTSSRYATASQHFVAIDAALDQSNGEITVNCGCNQKYYAYVYPNQPYEIYVCRAFWTAPLTGTDSKAGTLIHETSHFTAVAGTDDHVYGQSGAKSLAISDPASALDNADSHEYFAENTPSQN
ncbi:M35 family metallo-endopeptidase [Lysobacter sp. Root690]|uniref:M35 family metallo-endopeptidase n=1 Tax=Lysobacter sp. Root690 TaxID=1736588 RepID=UPI0006FEFF75|nr:M35 family metallo-endopeptidase [Lysobacter sp. Root690]KRB04427.1 protease [Lysobacter sp. Root690]